MQDSQVQTQLRARAVQPKHLANRSRTLRSEKECRVGLRLMQHLKLIYSTFRHVYQSYR